VPQPDPQTRIKDGRTWALGAEKDVAWINNGVSPGLSITASIPPVFAAYATLVFPLGLESSRDRMRPAEDRFDDALLPELMFPADRSWLVSSLWDDAWAGVGGSVELISALLIEPELRPRAERTDPSIPDMWPSSLPEDMHERLKR
jgi:hypothetical protein